MSTVQESWVPTAAQLNPRVSHERIFGDHPDAAYWLGVVASMGEIYDQETFNAIGRMRATVGVYQHGFFSAESVDEWGRERDSFDDQSIHLALVKNMQYGKHHIAALTGTIRAIVGRSDEMELPVEELSGVRFNRPKAEISRFMTYEKKNKIAQHTGSLALVRAVTFQLLERDIDTALFEIEKPVYRLLGAVGVPLTPIAEPQQVLEPGGLRTLYPLQVHVPAVIDSVTFPSREFFKNEEPNGGLGYFPKTLVGGYDE